MPKERVEFGISVYKQDKDLQEAKLETRDREALELETARRSVELNKKMMN
ncbi:hypothetical protein PF005_g18115 [Phytophthora fragariae]|uniref:Uncharacterized protein n=2 Tax=Phytophthora TaxID=4783 RepID=A0A6A3KXS4_9STRA|nr:hypothetical protein PF003_g14378 [Phytophthora fragariae]KAE9035449.1 hypothetical protein PR002_g7568 [Phytophthora rubi]KAE8928816.1 hypothetical protein PF009_g21055 [Phytophthora fragariae]KAE9008453.1 hypothetical protein PF011_g10704 [Phytophthora fragariae]KAE9088036.1 hypothetical protein PF010_g19512 [Phytophthora fragariae]